MAARGNYTDTELLRMQRDAEARVREMQNRARHVVETANETSFVPPRNMRNNRNWVSGPNTQRRSAAQQNRPVEPPAPPPEKPPQETPPTPGPEKAPPAPEPKAAPEAKSGTILGDIMRALNLDDDYLLIIGLMLILINQRADTTLILALAYLLI